MRNLGITSLGFCCITSLGDVIQQSDVTVVRLGDVIVVLHRMYYIVRLLLRSQKLVASNQCMKLWDAQSVDTKQMHFRSHVCIDEFLSAKHDCATGSQPA